MSFDIDKTIEMTQKIIVGSEKNRSISYLKLIKLLYICDRYMIERCGEPITGDDYYSMPKGPILSNVYELIKPAEKRVNSKFKNNVKNFIEKWDYYFETRAYNVVLIQPNENTQFLNNEENFVIESMLFAYGRYTGKELVDIIHDVYREWEKPRKGEEQSTRLPLKNIIKAIDDRRNYNPNNEKNEPMKKLNEYVDSLFDVLPHPQFI